MIEAKLECEVSPASVGMRMFAPVLPVSVIVPARNEARNLPRCLEALAIVGEAATEAGRDPAQIGMEGRVSWTDEGGEEKLIDHVGRWRAAGASHLTINTMRAGLGAVDGHLEVLTRAAEALALANDLFASDPRAADGRERTVPVSGHRNGHITRDSNRNRHSVRAALSHPRSTGSDCQPAWPRSDRP